LFVCLFASASSAFSSERFQDSIAVTQNFVNHANLRNVLQFLATKRDQISGYGTADDAVPVVEDNSEADTKGESGRNPKVPCPSHQLYESFTKALRLKKCDDVEITRTLCEFEESLAAAQPPPPSGHLPGEPGGGEVGSLWTRIVGDNGSRVGSGTMFALFDQ
jgi:hypothetical protein